MIRAGRSGTYAADWLDRNVIGIGRDFDGADIVNMSRKQIKAAYVSAHPAENKQEVAASVGQVYRFAHLMAQGFTIRTTKNLWQPPMTTASSSSRSAASNSTGKTWNALWRASSRPWVTALAPCPRDPTAVATLWPRPTHWGSSRRASWPRSSIARALWELPRFDRSSADCAWATVGSTSPRAASPRRRATRQSANVPIRPLDLDAFVCHYVEVYDRADDDTRSILPLTRI